MIEKINIKRFKNIENLEINSDRIHLLVGANNSGKSSILQAIQFAVSVAQTTSYELSRWNNDRLPTSITPAQLIYSPLKDVYSLAKGGRLTSDKNKSIELKFFEKDTGRNVEIIVRKGKNKNISTVIVGKSLGQELINIPEPFSIYVPGLAGIPSSEEYKNPAIVRRAAARGDANNVFRNILWLLKQHSSDWTHFINDIKDIFPNLILEIEFNPDHDEHINATIKIEGEKLPIDAAGTGVLQAIQIISYVNLYKPKILILDEPDSHLHPNNQRLLAKKLYDLANERGFQILISTHSRHLLGAFSQYGKIDWVVNGKIINEPYDFVKVLLDLGALDKGDLLKNGSIKCVVLTEDTDSKPIQILLKSSGFNISETDIWPYHGCTNIDTALVLAAFIRTHAPATKIILHRDRDYLTDEELETIKTKVESANILFFSTNGTDVESYFINASHINQIYPQIETANIQILVDEATAETRDDSVKKFINARNNIALDNYYKNRGKRPDNGQISIDSIRDYDSNPIRYRNGKLVFKRLQNKLQHTLGGNINIINTSSVLTNSRLMELKNDIWVTN